jgi:type IV pilus biogenesis protein CpaD/CtpE
MLKKLFVLVALSALLSACAGNKTQAVNNAPAKPVNTVYIWDADGHTDLALLRGLKAEAVSYMRSKGVVVSDNPEATDAYLKVTVIDAVKDEDANSAYIKARLYILSASDSSIIYDMTYEVKAKGDYPARKFVQGALKGYFK